MATFQQWNEAIINYVLAGLGVSSRVFLSIDDTAIEIVGLILAEPMPSQSWIDDFKRSIRHHCVHGDEVKLARFTVPLRDRNKRPRYVPFLAAMVLAAHNMGDDSGDRPIDPKDFFTHFNKVLGLPDQQGRTKGLTTGEDGRLWEDWNLWLRSQGFLPTASQGDGPNKFIQYPISQAILRESDKRRLWRHFTQTGWRKNLDEVLLMQRIRKDVQYLTKHLQEILDSKSDMWLRSYEAISRACFEVYEEWRETDTANDSANISAPRIRTSLDAKLYRREDFVSGNTEYLLFPRQIRQSISAELSVEFRSETYYLVEDRPGWYMPLWILDGEQLSNGLRLPLRSTNSLQYLEFPVREFWVLTLDPETPESGIYASWDKGVEIGKPFLLLVQDLLLSDIAKMKSEGLLDWESSSNVFEGWTEFRGVIVQAEAYAWTNIHLENDALRLTLQPRTNFSITFTGGLRAPRGLGWFVDNGPKVSLASFIPDAEMTVYSEFENVIFKGNIEAGNYVAIPWQGSGNYRVIINQNGQADEKIVRILDWSDIEPRQLDPAHFSSLMNHTVYGAMVKD